MNEPVVPPTPPVEPAAPAFDQTALLSTIEAQKAEIESLKQGITSQFEEIKNAINPPAPVDDEAYKPESWKALKDNTENTAKEIARKAIEEHERTKEEARKREDERIITNQKMIDDRFDELKKAGILSENKEEYAKQVDQIAGMALRLGTRDIEKLTDIANNLAPLWKDGYEYDHVNNTYIKKNNQQQSFLPTPPPVGSSSAKTGSAPAASGIDLRKVGGDLQTARSLWEKMTGGR